MIVMMIRVTVNTKIASKKSDLTIARDIGSALVGRSEGAKAAPKRGVLKRADKVKGYEEAWTGPAMVPKILIGLTRTADGEDEPRDAACESEQLDRVCTECASCGRKGVRGKKTTATAATSVDNRLGQTEMCVSSHGVAGGGAANGRTGRAAIQVDRKAGTDFESHRWLWGDQRGRGLIKITLIGSGAANDAIDISAVVVTQIDRNGA